MSDSVKPVGRVWTPTFDMTTVPDKFLYREVGRRNGGKRKSYSGGVIWSKHSDTKRCRCPECINKRNDERVAARNAPKRPRGRPLGWRKPKPEGVAPEPPKPRGRPRKHPKSPEPEIAPVAPAPSEGVTISQPGGVRIIS
jgi:hypothetical protein